MWSIISLAIKVLGLPGLIRGWLKARRQAKQSRQIEDQRTEIAGYKGKEAKDEFVKNVESSDNRLKSAYGQLRKGRYTKKNDRESL